MNIQYKEKSSSCVYTIHTDSWLPFHLLPGLSALSIAIHTYQTHSYRGYLLFKKLNFIEDNLYTIKGTWVHSVQFDEFWQCMYLCDPQHNHDIKHFYYPKKFHCPFPWSPPNYWSAVTIDYCFLDFHITLLWCMWLLLSKKVLKFIMFYFWVVFSYGYIIICLSIQLWMDT